MMYWLLTTMEKMAIHLKTPFWQTYKLEQNPNLSHTVKPEAPGHWLSGWGFSDEQKAKADSFVNSFVTGEKI